MSYWQPELTPSFSPSEMACKCGKCGGIADMDHFFMLSLQAMRDDIGPLTVTSGFRCPEHPEEKRKDKVGSHGQGLAADLKSSGGKRRFEIIQSAIKHGMIGIGVANSFIHVDGGHKHAGRPATWKY